MSIVHKLEMVHRQATEERSHYHVGSVCAEAIARIVKLETALTEITHAGTVAWARKRADRALNGK